MTSASDEDAYNYAKFLVEIFPDIAIDILCDAAICNLQKIEVRIDRACTKLGRMHKVKGLIQERRWDDLRILADKHDGRPSAASPAGTPVASGTLDHAHHTPGRALLPATPSSMASGSQSLPHNLSCERITVLYDDNDMQPLLARGSGTDDSFIGEDTIQERFPRLKRDWISNTKRVQVGGQYIDVAESVSMTWSLPGVGKSRVTKFWVVRPKFIRDADVLLSSALSRSPRQDNKGHFSPLDLGAGGGAPPQVPTPPPAFQTYSSSSGIQSIHESRAMSSINLGYPPMRNPRATRTSSVMTSSPTPSRPRQVPAPKASQSNSSECVMVNLAFRSKQKRLWKLDLRSSAEEVLSNLKAHVQRANGEESLDLSCYELTVSTLRKQDPNSQQAQLDEEDFDAYWTGIVDFICENKSPEPTKLLEFLFDIG